MISSRAPNNTIESDVKARAVSVSATFCVFLIFAQASSSLTPLIVNVMREERLEK